MKSVKNFKMFLESIDVDNGTPDTKGMIRNILTKISDNMNSGWKGTELVGSTECVILTDVDHTHDDDGHTGDEMTYNGWLEDLISLKDVEGMNEVLSLIQDNNEDLWEHGLTTTFTCVITEDVVLGDEDEDENTHLYNGWLEKLTELSM